MDRATRREFRLCTVCAKKMSRFWFRRMSTKMDASITPRSVGMRFWFSECSSLSASLFSLAWLYVIKFLAATIEARGQITEDRIAQAFDRLGARSDGVLSLCASRMWCEKLQRSHIFFSHSIYVPKQTQMILDLYQRKILKMSWVTMQSK